MQLLETISENPCFTVLWETHFAPVLETGFEHKGLSADVLKLTTQDTKTYLLKLSGKSAEYLERRHEVLHGTNVQSILLPCTFPAIPYLCLNNTILEVYPYVVGQTLNHAHSNRPKIEQLGKQIAVLHQQLLADDLAVDSLKLLPHSFQQLSQEIDLAEDRLQRNNSAKNSISDKYLVAVRHLCALSEPLCSGLQDKIDNLSTSQLIHGDLHGDNIIIDLNNRLHLIDFDKMMMGPRIFDLAKFIVCSLFTASGKMDKQQVKALLVGYQSQSVITQTEQNLLLPLILGLQLNSRWLLRKYSVVPDKVRGLIQQNTLQINWINDNFSNFQAFFEHELF